MGHVAAVRCVQYDGRRVVSGAYDFMVKVWDPETETCLHTLQGHTNRVYSLQVRGLTPLVTALVNPNMLSPRSAWSIRRSGPVQNRNQTNLLFIFTLKWG